jgi:hypothetical protein
MDVSISSLLEKIQHLEIELDAEVAKRAAQLRFGFEHGKLVFEEEVLRRHRELRVNVWNYIKRANIMLIVTAPLIYSLIIPVVILDLFLFVYQSICFPTYGLKRVKRGDYVVFDRHHLAYLNIVEKINCAFCSYANGVLSYGREIASVTEAYWCPIKHAKRLMGTQARYREFVDFGDAEGHHEAVKAFYKKLNK